MPDTLKHKQNAQIHYYKLTTLKPILEDPHYKLHSFLHYLLTNFDPSQGYNILLPTQSSHSYQKQYLLKPAQVTDLVSD